MKTAWVTINSEQDFPEVNGEYLVRFANRAQAVMAFDNTAGAPTFGQWVEVEDDGSEYEYEDEFDFIPYDSVTHWQPLPTDPDDIVKPANEFEVNIINDGNAHSGAFIKAWVSYQRRKGNPQAETLWANVWSKEAQAKNIFPPNRALNYTVKSKGDHAFIRRAADN